ncbi:hypothetical protein OF83DRAFT_1109151, partial [Amylostereum chailletii]
QSNMACSCAISRSSARRRAPPYLPSGSVRFAYRRWNGGAFGSGACKLLRERRIHRLAIRAPYSRISPSSFRHDADGRCLPVEPASETSCGGLHRPVWGLHGTQRIQRFSCYHLSFGGEANTIPAIRLSSLKCTDVIFCGESQRQWNGQGAVPPGRGHREAQTVALEGGTPRRPGGAHPLLAQIGACPARPKGQRLSLAARTRIDATICGNIRPSTVRREGGAARRLRPARDGGEGVGAFSSTLRAARTAANISRGRHGRPVARAESSD